MGQCLGVSESMGMQEMVNTRGRCVARNMGDEARIIGVTRTCQALNAILKNQE